MGWKLFKRSETPEQKLKREITERALAMADDEYKKQIMLQSLQETPLNYAIIQDLMRAAQFTGKVTIKMKSQSGDTSTEIVIENPNVRTELGRLDELRFYAELNEKVEGLGEAMR